MNRQTFISRVLLLLLCSVTLACGSNSPTAPSSTVAPPQSTGVSPATGVRGTSVPVTLTGAQFAPGATTAVAVSGDGVAVTNVSVQSATTVTATLTIAADAVLGARTISVTNTGGTGQGLTFTVVPLPPTLEAVTPVLVQAGTSAVLTLQGTNFIDAATTVAISGTGLSISDVAVASATTLTVSVSASQAADISAREVTVATPGGPSAGQLIAVLPPRMVVTSVSVSGGRLRIGERSTITMSGSGFVPGLTTLKSNHPGLQVLAVRIGNAPAAPIRGARNTTLAAGTGTVASFDVLMNYVSGFLNRPALDYFWLAPTLNMSALIDVIGSSFAGHLGPIGSFYEDDDEDEDEDGTGGATVEIPIDVAPPLPKIGGFEAIPSVVSQGQSSTLKWRGIEYATTCVITSIGDVPCADGSVVVSPSQTREYRLTVTGAGGDSEWAAATVVVEIPVVEVPVVVTPITSSTTFTTVGTPQSFTVPAGVTQVTLEVSGGSGGTGAGSTPSNSGAAGGLGGRVTATVAVTPGESLTVMVGGRGTNAVNGGAFGFGGGADGIGDGANSGNPGLGGGGGGGASSVRRGSTVLAIAGGGGGGGGNAGNTLGGTGGAGGSTGADGNGQTTADSGTGGGGATQSATGGGGAGAGHPGGGGDPGSGRDGGEGGEGSNASSGAGGGGGGGAFGGGGGGGGALGFGQVSGGGGGGGSSTTIGSATSVTLQRGVQSGNGSVVIRW